MDVEFMRALHQRVNIVPVLAKADALTPAEVERMKNKVKGGWSSLEPSQQVPGDGGALGAGVPTQLGTLSIPCPEFVMFAALRSTMLPTWPPRTHLPWCSAGGWKGLEGRP